MGEIKLSKDTEFYSVSDAIEDVTTPDPYICDGKLERLEYENRALRDFVGRLTKIVLKQANELEIEELFDYKFAVEES